MGTLNMSKPGADQIASSDAVSGNRAEIIAEETAEEGVFSQLTSFVSSLLKHFK